LCLVIVLFNTAYACKTYKPHKFKPSSIALDTGNISPASIIQFAQSLIGIRYRPSSADLIRGFDCSGFVSYVFKKFNFDVPRSSSDFINIGEKIRFEDARPGDIILFTGTKKHTRRIGHIAIVLYNGIDEFRFIHSTSGKEYGVTITTMDATYKRRFVQIIRLLKQNNYPDNYL
jgi:murein DD-endopeptidase / murein LD-carboxypeptidase